MTSSLTLFEEIVARTGLATFIGPGVVQRALQSVGIYSFEVATVEDYRRALPALRARMATYLTEDQVEIRLREIMWLLR